MDRENPVALVMPAEEGLNLAKNSLPISQACAQDYGDRHNFGKSVQRLDRGWLSKPRPLIWEHLFLDERSPLRSLLRESPLFDFLPVLSIDPEIGFIHSGRVQSLNFDATDREIDRIQQAANMGALIGMCLWFGIVDLHHENVKLGFQNGKQVLAPIDIECIWQLTRFSTQTLLMPVRDQSYERSGFSFLESETLDGDLLALVCNAYFEAIWLLESQKARILSTLSGLRDLTARVLLRSTSYYTKYFVQGAIPSRGFIRAEWEQLERGDIPYFFRFCDSAKILSFMDSMCDPHRGRVVEDAAAIFDHKFMLLSDEGVEVPKEVFSFWLRVTPIQIVKCLQKTPQDRQGQYRETGVSIAGNLIEVRYKNLVSRGQYSTGEYEYDGKSQAF